jgi:nitrogen fixation/metabolism regulation signal transduction histidine kinase
MAGLAVIRSRVIVPLEQLAATLTEIGQQGHPAARVDLQRGAREFRTLSASINSMLHQLEQQQAMQRDRDAALEANRLKSEFLPTSFRRPRLLSLLQRRRRAWSSWSESNPASPRS